MGDFDVRSSQPHPPGHPLFVAQMRALRLLGFKNPHSNLTALAMAGSIAALWLVVGLGNRLFAHPAGWCAALLLLWQPAFWYAGLTSAVRVRLAGFSVATAWACYRAWHGERRWVAWSGLILGVSAGVRPELGPALMPLWVAGVW
ncbi:MAG: glycosyltransferase family 39 protein [Bryobacteraceae bacterium]